MNNAFGDVPAELHDPGDDDWCGGVQRGSRLPRVSARLVPRERLMRRLDRLAPLTVLQALPGTGKTTLVAQWVTRLQTRDIATAWFRLTPKFNDPDALVRALRPAFDRSGLVVVVLDDAHHVRSPEVADLLVQLIVAHPSAHVVACSAGEDELTRAAARHVIGTQLIRGAEMSISASELPVWAEAWGHRVTARQCGELVEMVGGWALPLQIVLDSTPSWADSFVTQVACDYVKRTVLPSIRDEGALADASRLALMTRFDFAVAIALLEDPSGGARGHADQRIQMLESAGLLWPAGSKAAPAWRFPTLVRRGLAQCYERVHPDAARADHRTIARTLRSSGRSEFTGAVLDHARRGQDWSLLSRVWLEESWQLLHFAADEFARAYSDLPAPIQRSQPTLHLPASLADALVEAPADDPETRARFIMRHYVQAGLDYLGQSSEPTASVDRIERLTAAMVGLRQRGRVGEALALAPRVERELAKVRGGERWGKRSIQSSWFTLQWGLTQMLSGHRSYAIALITRAYEISPSGLTGSMGTAMLALTHAMNGSATEARSWLTRHESIDLSGWWFKSLAETPARLTRASLALDRLDVTTAAAELDTELYSGDEFWPVRLRLHTRLALFHGDPFEMLSRLSDIRQLHHVHLEPAQNVVGIRTLDRCRAELLLAAGEVDKAAHLLGEVLELPGWLRPAATRLRLIVGDHAQAQRMATTLAWADEASLRDRAELLMIGAVAALQRDRDNEAAAAFQQAHALCRQADTFEPYLSSSPGQLRRLLELSGVVLSAEATTAIATARFPYPAAASTTDLSPREREVLRQMRVHDTARAIARALNVSVNTVRKQLVSIYAKLGVHDRAAALSAAERLGFFESNLRRG